jgi:preprotein translocase subunit SecF
MFDLVGKRFWYFLLSALLLLPGVIFLVLFGVRWGIEFTSGSTMTLVFQRSVSQAELRQWLAGQGLEKAMVQNTHKPGFSIAGEGLTPEAVATIRGALQNEFGTDNLSLFTTEGSTSLTLILSHVREGYQSQVRGILEGLGYSDVAVEPIQKEAFFVRTRTLKQEPQGEEQLSEKARLEQALEEQFGSFALFDFYSVSPIIAREMVLYAAIAVAVASLAIMLYIAWAFRRMPQPLRYGVCTIIALVHDILMVLGIFALLGKVAGMEVDAMFITGVLTVMGYSVNDTVVVFDRIRENLTRNISRDFETTVNFSLVQTLGRSLNTSLTTLLVVLALLLLGGVTLRNFIFVLFIGITAGTYSSLFIASPLLVVWEKGEWRKFLPWVALSRVARSRG